MRSVSLNAGDESRIFNGDEIRIAGTDLILHVIDATMFSQGNSPKVPALTVRLASSEKPADAAPAKVVRPRKAKEAPPVAADPPADSPAVPDEAPKE